MKLVLLFVLSVIGVFAQTKTDLATQTKPPFDSTSTPLIFAVVNGQYVPVTISPNLTLTSIGGVWMLNVNFPVAMTPKVFVEKSIVVHNLTGTGATVQLPADTVMTQNVKVYRNGLKGYQTTPTKPGDYSVNLNTKVVTMDQPLATGDTITVEYFVTENAPAL